MRQHNEREDFKAEIRALLCQLEKKAKEGLDLGVSSAIYLNAGRMAFTQIKWTVADADFVDFEEVLRTLIPFSQDERDQELFASSGEHVWKRCPNN
ncbi:MAG: hypothetical protein ABIN80_20445 [Dyadobacter sp.]|uniref:hypothetical protein n=1 Tax=Dyadobacter sp. TaxID=1914288 RepID=UPI003267C069